MNFKDPWILMLIPVAVLLISWISRRHAPAGFRFPSVGLASGLPATWKIRFHWVPLALRTAAVVFFIVALAGPRSVLEETKSVSEGIDIVLAVDSSGSMAAEDFKINGQRYNRLSVVKNVVRGFIAHRENDRIGLIAFAKQAHTVCPLTIDHDWLLTNLERVDLGMMEDGTAIGSAVSSSLSRLENSDAKSRIIILLTDGINNSGEIDPLTAARAAQALGIKIYTIGVGSRGYAPYPVKDFFGRTVYQNVKIDLDEEMLMEIAHLTNGEYFRATDTESLKKIYEKIDVLEKTKIEEFGYKEYRQLFGWFLAMALVLLLSELLLINTVFLKVP